MKNNFNSEKLIELLVSREGKYIDDRTATGHIASLVLVMKNGMVCPIERSKRIKLRHLYIGNDNLVHMTKIYFGTEFDLRDELNDDYVKDYNESLIHYFDEYGISGVESYLAEKIVVVNYKNKIEKSIIEKMNGLKAESAINTSHADLILQKNYRKPLSSSPHDLILGTQITSLDAIMSGVRFYVDYGGGTKSLDGFVIMNTGRICPIYNKYGINNLIGIKYYRGFIHTDVGNNFGILDMRKKGISLAKAVRNFNDKRVFERIKKASDKNMINAIMEAYDKFIRTREGTILNLLGPDRDFIIYYQEL